MSKSKLDLNFLLSDERLSLTQFAGEYAFLVKAKEYVCLLGERSYFLWVKLAYTNYHVQEFLIKKNRFY